MLANKSGMSGSKLPHPSTMESTVSLPFVPTKLYCLLTTEAPACELLAVGRRMKKECRVFELRHLLHTEAVSLPFDHYQIILFGNGGTCTVTAQRSGESVIRNTSPPPQ